MKICVTTFGSVGDVEPYLALALGLQTAGHEVVFASVDHFAERARSLGLSSCIVGRPWRDPPRPVVERAFRERNPAKQAALFTSLLVDDMVATVPDLIELAREADLVVSHMFNVPGVAAARVNRKPLVVGHLFHNAIPGRESNPLGANLPRGVNRALWGLARRLMRRHTDPLLNRIVRAAGLPAWQDILFERAHSELLNLIAISPSLLARDSAWPAHYVVTGHWFLSASEYEPGPALRDFLAVGPAVVVTLGSMGKLEAQAGTALFVEAAARAGARIVIQAGWGGFGRSALPAHALGVEAIPHDWLLPRASCVVHHGGAGTTAAVVRAGVPSIVVPHLGDQFLWARMLEAHGVSGGTIAARELSAPALARSLRATLEDVGLRERAERLAERVRSENGVATAVAAIERVWSTLAR